MTAPIKIVKKNTQKTSSASVPASSTSGGVFLTKQKKLNQRQAKKSCVPGFPNIILPPQISYRFKNGLPSLVANASLGSKNLVQKQVHIKADPILKEKALSEQSGSSPGNMRIDPRTLMTEETIKVALEEVSAKLKEMKENPEKALAMQQINKHLPPARRLRFARFIEAGLIQEEDIHGIYGLMEESKIGIKNKDGAKLPDSSKMLLRVDDLLKMNYVGEDKQLGQHGLGEKKIGQVVPGRQKKSPKSGVKKNVKRGRPPLSPELKALRLKFGYPSSPKKHALDGMPSPYKGPSKAGIKRGAYKKTLNKNKKEVTISRKVVKKQPATSSTSARKRPSSSSGMKKSVVARGTTRATTSRVVPVGRKSTSPASVLIPVGPMTSLRLSRSSLASQFQDENLVPFNGELALDRFLSGGAAGNHMTSNFYTVDEDEDDRMRRTTNYSSDEIAVL